MVFRVASGAWEHPVQADTERPVKPSDNHPAKLRPATTGDLTDALGQVGVQDAAQDDGSVEFTRRNRKGSVKPDADGNITPEQVSNLFNALNLRATDFGFGRRRR